MLQIILNQSIKKGNRVMNMKYSGLLNFEREGLI